MRIFLFTTALLFFVTEFALAQCDDLPGLGVINTAGQILTADSECTDANGWIHFYNSTNDKILLSVKSNGQNIGSIGSGLVVKAGTLSGYGAGGYNLSDADYIDNDIWIISNRFWQITGANAINSPVRIRFYFTGTDVSDVAGSVDDFGFFVDEPDDLLMYTISKGGGLDPLTLVTQPFNALFTLYDMVPGPAPDWTSGTFNGFPFGEYETSTLDISGGGGFLIFQSDELLAISGNISRLNGTPVPDVNVQAASISVGGTDASGNYTCPTLLAGASYDVIPAKDINHAEGLSSADLIAISLHLLGIEPFSNPYQYIAADANHDAFISFNDIEHIRDVLLGISPDFPNNQSWRFVPQSYVFPNPADPFTPPFPEKITVTNLQDSLFNQNFIGVKTGNVVDPDPLSPPALNTSFSLQQLTACNPGDTVTFDLTATDFQNIRAFQFTLEWNPNVMEYVNTGAFSLSGLSAQSIGSTAATDGKLTFLWYNPMASGSSVANGAALCQIHFVASGNIGNATSVDFTGSATEMLLLHQNLSQVVPASTSGSLSIQNSSDISAIATILPTSCDGAPTGIINLMVSGGVPPFTYQWSNAATTEDIANLPAGNYDVTVSDASGNCPRVFSFVLPFPPPVEIEASVEGMSCPYQLNGAIDMEVVSGIYPYQYAWSNGSNTQDLENLYQGMYTVTVTDAAGCTLTSTFEVTNLNKISPVVSITNASPPSLSNGSVMIETINGGVPPFSFEWSNGSTSQSLEDVPAGNYIVTITDNDDCQHVFGYVVYSLTTAAGEVPENPVQMNLYPNPVQSGHSFHIAMESDLSGKVNITIFSPDGKLVSQDSIELLPGQTIKTLAAPATSGLYFVQIQMEDYPAGWLKVIVQ